MFCRAYLRKEVFQEYEYQWHEPVDLGISLRSLLSAASILSDNSQLDVRLDWRQCNLTMFLEKQALTPDDRPGGCQAVVQLSLLELDDVVAPGELAEIHQDMKLVNAANAADTERWLFNKSRTLVDLTARADLVKDHLAEIEQPNAKSVTLDIDSRQIKFHVTADGSQWTLIMPRDFADLFSTYQIHESVKVRYNVNILGCGASVQTRGAMLHTLCALFSKSTSHVLKFLDPDRPHVKSGILSDLNSRGYLMYSNPNIEEAIWLMLYKLRLNQDALMKLDVPPISGILEEDDAYERRLKKNDKAAAQAASEAPEAKENSEDSFDVVETPVETEVEEDNGPEEADETVDAEAAEAAEEAQGPSELDVALVAAAEAAGMDVSAQLSELSDVEKEHMLVALEAAGGSVGGSDKDLFASMKADSIMTRAFAGRDLDDDDEEEVDSDEEEDALKPFKNDLEYLELWFQVVRNQIDGHELEW
ncbi:MAG: hypothetical protein MHM6MM_007580, partial [Cercozoa sp. M6MM]